MTSHNFDLEYGDPTPIVLFGETWYPRKGLSARAWAEWADAQIYSVRKGSSGGVAPLRIVDRLILSIEYLAGSVARWRWAVPDISDEDLAQRLSVRDWPGLLDPAQNDLVEFVGHAMEGTGGRTFDLNLASKIADQIWEDQAPDVGTGEPDPKEDENDGGDSSE